jgi:hypothetical protein
VQSLANVLGDQRYAQLQDRLACPTLRAQRVLQVTAAAWWPDGVVPLTRKAAERLVRAQSTPPQPAPHARSRTARAHRPF